MYIYPGKVNSMKIFTKTLLLSVFLTVISCGQSAPVNTELGIQTDTIKLGTEQNGTFTEKTEKTFVATDKIALRFKAKGLTIKQNKVKVNIDVFLKKDKDILASQSDILGTDGLTETISGVPADYTGTSGEAEVALSITPPTNVQGEVTANLTLKDLNSNGKISSFETKFTLK